MYKRFSCFAVHSKMSQSTNAKSKPMEGLYTDTDPDDRSEIITDVTIRMPGKAGTMMMEVKVDPWAQPSCIPLHKFKTLFPHLCRDGLPKEGLLDNTQNEFQSYNGGDMTCYGHILIDVKDKVTKKYHPIRFYVMNTDMPRILISHAASYWLGLVRVLCYNKARRIKRQVASIDKKSDFRAKSGHFRTSSPNMASSSQKKQMTPKTVTSGKVHVPSPRMHNFEDAKIQGRKTATGVRPGRDVDVSDGEQHSQEEPSVTNGKELKTSKSGNSVHSGPNKNITDSVKDSPFSNQTASSSNTKSGPKMKHTSKKAPHRKYYKPSNDTKTFQINNKGHLQCMQDPNLIHKPNDKGKLPGSREAPIYHEPGTVSCKTMEDLKKLYPNSFDRLGSLKGAYNIRVDPTVKPVTHARRKVPIESKEAIDRELDYLIEEEIIMEQVEPTPWVSSVTFPRKPNGDVRVCLDPSNLNKAIIREHHKPMTVEEIAHELAGATVYTKADALKAFLQIHLMHEVSLLTTFNSHRTRLRFLWMPFGAKMSQDVFQLRMDAILEQCPGVIGIHDDMVIFGVDQEELTKQGWLHQRRHVPRLVRRYWDFRDELSTDDGMLLKGPRLIIPGELQEEYLSCLHEGHLSASKVQENAKQHMYWTGINADIEDYTKRCQECIKRSQVPKEPLQPHDIPEGPWRKLGIDYFAFDGNSYVLICDYFSKFPFLYRAKTSF